MCLPRTAEPGLSCRADLELLPFTDRQSGADWVAAQLQGAERGEVAVLTRAKHHLYIVYTDSVPSRFLSEAGLAVK